MKDQLRVKSPTGCVHIVESALTIHKSTKVEYSTLCAHKNYYVIDGYFYLWEETSEPATCIRCIKAHRHLREQAALTAATFRELKLWDFTRDTTFQEAKMNMTWGTYGKLGNEPLEYRRLIDCSTNHLKAILRTQNQIVDLTRLVIESILEDRRAK